MFASKAPREIFDPGPPTGDYWWDQRYAAAMHSWESRFVQGNPPNPLLRDYRLDIAHTTWATRDPLAWLQEVTENWPGVVLPFTEEQIDHARRVLSRLPALR